MRRRNLLAVAAIVALLAVACEDGTRDTPRATPRTTTASPTVAFQLATIDQGTNPSATTVARYDRALDRAEPKCTQTRRTIGDMAVRSVELLRDNYGIRATTLEMIEAVDQSIPPGERMDCAEIFAILVLLMGG
jgi:hypothetical protein